MNLRAKIITPLKFAVARRREIDTVRSLAFRQNGTKLAFQKLPRHMRRRIMSHSIKRVPVVIREVHLNQLTKSGLPPKQKRPSRKHRRRPLLLSSEIARRQRSNKWLETHIWHAKRYHMVNKWSYKIPFASCDKSFRASYRATAKHCLLQDISYWGCIELIGPEDQLIKAFRKVTKSNEGLTINAKAYIGGYRQGQSMFYKVGLNTPIGTVLFNWMPIQNSAQSRTVWLWAHAAYFKELFDELAITFDQNRDEESEIQLTDLRFELNRFRLTGPLSQAVLCKALQPANATGAKSWFKTYLEDDVSRQLFADQIDYWNAIKDLPTAGCLTRNIILQLIIDDPRLNMPSKRTKAINSPSSHAAGLLPPKHISAGAIWSKEIRKHVYDKRISTAKLNQLRSQCLVPSADIEFKKPRQIPILLLQRPGNPKTGYTSGWDVIVPRGWGQTTWICLVMWGARSGGYRETESINFELGQALILPPDSAAGKSNEAELDLLNKRKYFKLPPNKRTNYNKFAAVSPLTCNWDVLCKDWGCPNGEFNVVRNPEMLNSIQANLQNRKHKCPTIDASLLVPVRIRLKSGTIDRYSMICLPSKDDREEREILEPPRKDINCAKRNALRKEHRLTLKRLMRKRHVLRQKGRKITIDPTANAEFLRQMKALWLPDVNEGIRTSSSREVMGFIVKGDVSLLNGHSQGIGYVPYPALKQFTELRRDCKVLVRNTNSRKYRFAHIEVIT